MKKSKSAASPSLKKSKKPAAVAADALIAPAANVMERAPEAPLPNPGPAAIDPITLSPNLILGTVLVLGFVFLWWNHAWLGDDINLTIRSVFNFVNGMGIVWNPGERVQAFTHPLWFFLLVIAQALTRHLFHAIFVQSFLCSGAAFLGLLKKGTQPLAKVILGSLLLSQSYNDYTSSGLENPLSYLLIFFVLERFFSRKIDVWFYLLVSLTFLNRMDHILILAPLILWGLKQTRFRLKPLLLAAIPSIAWLAFSLFYFGFPLPNTFLGKLNTGYAAAEYHDRFVNYLEFSYHHDPITLILLAIGIVLPLLLKAKESLISLGLLLYLIYLRQIGGDFMGGRLFSIPVFVGVYAMIACGENFDWSTKKNQLYRISITSGLGVVLVALVLLTNTPFSNRSDYKNVAFEKGVADERGFYFEYFSLVKGDILDTFPRPSVENFTLMCGLVGYYSLSNIDTYIYDSCGLGSPYSSRLPAIHSKDWRIGHHERHLVPGFPCWLKNQGLTFDDPEVTRLLNDIRLVASGPLFDGDRLRAIARLNFTAYEYDRKALENPVIPDWRSGRDCPIIIQPFKS